MGKHNHQLVMKVRVMSCALRYCVPWYVHYWLKYWTWYSADNYEPDIRQTTMNLIFGRQLWTWYSADNYVLFIFPVSISIHIGSLMLFCMPQVCACMHQHALELCMYMHVLKACMCVGRASSRMSEPGRCSRVLARRCGEQTDSSGCMLGTCSSRERPDESSQTTSQTNQSNKPVK